MDEETLESTEGDINTIVMLLLVSLLSVGVDGNSNFDVDHASFFFSTPDLFSIQLNRHTIAVSVAMQQNDHYNLLWALSPAIFNSVSTKREDKKKA